MKGATEAVAAYRVLGRRTDPGRLRGIEGLSAPLIGRAKEMETLRQVMADARQGRGQIVSLMGEAGLGKSRLIEEMRAEWRTGDGEKPAWVAGHGVSYDMSRPYGLFLQQVRQACRVDEGEPREAVLRKIAELENMPEEAKALLARAVEVLLAARSGSDGPRLEGEAVKRELFDVSLDFWRAMLESGPAVIVCDDLHWADPASEELLMHLFQLAEEGGVLFLCSFRPERKSPAWRVKQAVETDYPHLYTELALSPLSNDDSDELIANLLTISDLPEQLRLLVLQKAEGNPFFVEEVVRTLIDSGAVERDQSTMRWTATADVGDIAIPDTLQSLLVSRFDRLEEAARGTLQLASVIGRSFYYKVLKLVSDSAVTLERQLSTLQRVELIREAARQPELEYMFRHELTREAAYGSILLRRRREYHRQVGEAIEELFSDRLEDQANRLANHFDVARDSERALKYYAMAGDAAARLYANTEAVSHYTRAIEVATRGPAGNVHLVYLYTKRGRAMELSARFDDALANYQELEALGRERDEPALALGALIPQATLYSTYTPKFDPERGESLSNQTLVLARELEDHPAEAKALWNLMLVEFYGHEDAHGAVKYGEESVAVAREHNLREELAYALNDLAKAYFTIGRSEESWSAGREAGELFRDLGNMPMLADNLNGVSFAMMFAGDLEQTLSLAEESLRVSESIHNTWGEIGAKNNICLAKLESGLYSDAVIAAEEAAALTQEVRFEGPVGDAAFLAWILAQHGDIDRAVEVAAEGAVGNEGADPSDLAVDAYVSLRAGNLENASQAFEEVYAGRGDANPTDFTSLFGLFDSIACEFALANRDYDRVLEVSGRRIEAGRAMGLRIFLSDFLRFKAQALIGLERPDEAREVLAEARAEAEAQGSRRSLWPILSVASQLEAEQGHPAEAEALRLEAAKEVEFIAEHAGSPERRALFVALPIAAAVLEI